MRKLITAGISASAVSAALLAGTSVAHAETARVAGQPSGVGTVDTALHAQAAGWEYYSWYFSQNNCLVAGSELSRNDPSIRQTRCDEHKSGIWYLYLLR